MSTPSSSDLLRPTVAGGKPQQAPYSLQTAFLSSFFGGPFAAVAIFLINARRIGRLRADLTLGVLLALLYIAIQWWWRTTPGGAAFNGWLIGSLGAGGGGYVDRLLGLVAFAAGSMLHRREHKASDLMGQPRPHGLSLGLALIVGGWMASVVLKGLFK